jgi:hypothetical protein
MNDVIRETTGRAKTAAPDQASVDAASGLKLSWMSGTTPRPSEPSGSLATPMGELEGGAFDAPPSSYKLISWATRSRCQVASPNVNSDDLARLKYRCRSCSQVKPMPPWSWMPAPAALRKASET